MHKRTSLKGHIVMYAALILLFLVMVSFWMVSGLFARYTSSSIGTDDARVASFVVHAVEIDGKDMSMDLGDSEPIAIYALQVQNKSEVAVRCDVSITFNDALLAGVGITLSDDITADASDLVFTIPSDRMSASIENIVDLSVSAAVNKYILFTPSAATYTALGEEATYSSSNEMTIGVTFEQID